jgi:hypothetical protein
MTMTFEAKRINHVAELCRRKKLDRKSFIREAGYHAKLSRPTLEKAYDGATDLDYNVVEKLAWFFDVSPQEVLESKF